MKGKKSEALKDKTKTELHGKKEYAQQNKEPTFMTYDRSGSCLKANDSRHIVIGQNVHSNSVRAGQNSTSTFSEHQTNYDAFVILWLGIIQNG
jgi:hypothetical protein